MTVKLKNPDPASVENCPCATWARAEPPRLWLSHHPRCSSLDVEAEVYPVLLTLLEGINKWCGEEGGIPEAFWPEYSAACRLIGRLVKRECALCEKEMPTDWPFTLCSDCEDNLNTAMIGDSTK